MLQFFFFVCVCVFVVVVVFFFVCVCVTVRLRGRRVGVLASLLADVLDCKSSDLGLTPDHSRVWDFYPSAKSFQIGININVLLSATILPL